MDSDATASQTSGGGGGGASGGPIIGIDLGTTNSLVAHCTEAGPVILASPEGERSLPSVVRLLARGSGTSVPVSGAPYTVAALGHEARRHAVEFPTTTLHSVKRLMGRGVADLTDDRDHLPYKIVEGPNQTARIALPPPENDTPEGDTPQASNLKPQASITPQEVSAVILRELKRWADAALRTDVTRAVVTVPAYFDDAQRQATRDAGRLAGLNVLRIVNEPTAAALAYGIGLEKKRNTQTPENRTRGSGTSVPVIPSPKPPQTLSLNTKLNPDACTEAEDTSPIPDPRSPDPATQTVAIYDLGGGTFDVSILRLQQTDETSGSGTIDQVLATDGDTHLGGDDFDHAIINLIQSEIQSKILNQKSKIDFPPATRQAFRTLAEQTKIKLSAEEQATIEIDLQGLTPDPGPRPPDPTYQRTLTRAEFESLITPALDRTLDACRRALKNAKLTPEKIDRVILVGGSTRIPLVREKVATLFGREPYTALNPDEVVALGASVQAAVLAGIKRDTLLLDVIPLSLGIETMGGAVAKLITANSTIPARATEMFSTYADGQTNIKIHVLQGERELVKDCRSLATFDLTGVPPMPAGLPKINVTFLVDANGILSVQAVEERSGRRAHIQIVPNHGLTRDEITAIEKDSFTHARADMTAHRLIDLRLNARLDLRNIQKQLDRFEHQGPRGQGAQGQSENQLESTAPSAQGSGTPGGSVPVSDPPKSPKDSPPHPNQKSSIKNQKSDTLDPAYRAEIEAHMQTVQTHIDTPDADSDPDAFQQALHDLDHATLRLAELNIARTLRESS